MINECNPTYDEIEEWAYSDEHYPCEDWDIIVFDQVSDEALNELVLKIASDVNCPKQREFLRFLRIMTGSVVRFAVRDGFNKKNLSVLQGLIDKASKSSVKEVVEWSQKSKAVVAAPETFRYEDWYNWVN